MPSFTARALSASVLKNSRPCICPPTQRSAEAASTPSGAPPRPRQMSMPVAGSEVAMMPATSPSVMRRTAAPTLRTAAMMLLVARTVEDAGRDLARMHVLGLGERQDVLLDVGVEIDGAFGIAAADGDLVHVDVGRVEQRAGLGDRQHRQRVRQRLGGQRGAFQRIERDIDLDAAACRPSRR